VIKADVGVLQSGVGRGDDEVLPMGRKSPDLGRMETISPALYDLLKCYTQAV